MQSLLPPPLLALFLLLGCSSPKMGAQTTDSPTQGLELPRIAVAPPPEALTRQGRSRRGGGAESAEYVNHLEDLQRNGLITQGQREYHTLKTDLGSFEAEVGFVENVLSSSKCFEVYARLELGDIQRELATTRDDIWFDQDSVEELGKLKGVQYLAKYYQAGRFLVVKIIRVRTGKVVYEGRIEYKLKAWSAQAGLDLRSMSKALVEDIQNHKEAFALENPK